MAVNVLNKLLSCEISLKVCLNWLADNIPQSAESDPSYKAIQEVKCTREEFMRGFLNVLHEEISCDKFGYIAPIFTTPRRNIARTNEQSTSADPTPGPSTRTSLNDSDLNTSNLSSNSLNRSNVSCNSPETQSGNRDLDVSQDRPSSSHSRSHSTPRNKKGAQRGRERVSPLCLGDFIVNKKHSATKKAGGAKKRITPTSVESERNVENSFDFQNVEEDVAECSRTSLVKDKPIMSETNQVTVAPAVTKVVEEIVPDPNLVTHDLQMNIFIEIYNFLLSNHYVLNVTSEMYFLISLFLAKQQKIEGCADVPHNKSDSKVVKLNQSEMFKSIHNVTYLALNVLRSQCHFFNYFDKSTLSLLMENERLQLFSKPLVFIIQHAHSFKSERVVHVNYGHCNSYVCFDADTDLRENFPNDASFHAFKKQRDLFYEILRIWETNHMDANFDFQITLGKKIRTLFGYTNETTNFIHFSKLFKLQLLKYCESQHKQDEEPSSVPFLPLFVNVDSTKLQRLNARIKTKQLSNGLNALPTFHGTEEFFKEFIETANNYAFNRHLCDTLITELIDMNNKDQFEMYHDIQNAEEIFKKFEPHKPIYTDHMKVMKVMAKFLGFIESLPYKCELADLSETFLANQIRLRNKVRLHLMVKSIVKDAIIRRRTILTIPWVTKYLAMLDAVTLRLPYYTSTFKLLFYLYQKNQDVTVCRLNIGLVRLCLGWLFSLPHFPNDEFFKFVTSSNSERYLQTEAIQERVPDKFYLVDARQYVDESVLYMWCPYLIEIKKLLTTNSRSGDSGVAVKHITPVATFESQEKKLQRELREAFLSGQSESTKKSIDYVNECVASSCVKHISSVLIPDAKKIIQNEIIVLTMENVPRPPIPFDPPQQILSEAELKSKKIKIVEEQIQILKTVIDKETKRIVKEQIPMALKGLLPVDTLEAARVMCCGIAAEACLKKLSGWIRANVNISIFEKDIHNEYRNIVVDQPQTSTVQKPDFRLPFHSIRKEHNENTMSPFELLDSLRETCVEILEKNNMDNDELAQRVCQLLDNAKATLCERQDVNESVNKYVCKMVSDMSLLLVAYKPKVMRKDNVFPKLLQIFKLPHPCTQFTQFLSLRNMLLMEQAGHKRLESDIIDSWVTLAEFSMFLINNGIISEENFEYQCVSLYQSEWKQPTLRYLTIFMKDFLDRYAEKNGGNVGLFQGLDFLSEYCIDSD